MNHGLQQYQERATQTARPGRLVVMLYDGFLRFAGQARVALEAGDVGEAGLKLTRAQDIITELRVTLDMERGGEIARNLASLYLWITERLTSARLTKSVDELDSAVSSMSELRDAWAEVAHVERPQVRLEQPVVGVNLAG